MVHGCLFALSLWHLLESTLGCSTGRTGIAIGELGPFFGAFGKDIATILYIVVVKSETEAVR